MHLHFTQTKRSFLLFFFCVWWVSSLVLSFAYSMDKFISTCSFKTILPFFGPSFVFFSSVMLFFIAFFFSFTRVVLSETWSASAFIFEQKDFVGNYFRWFWRNTNSSQQLKHTTYLSCNRRMTIGLKLPLQKKKNVKKIKIKKKLFKPLPLSIVKKIMYVVESWW